MEISGRGRAAELAKLLLGVQEADQPTAKSSAKAHGQGDRIQISAQAKELQRIKALANQPDQTRAEYVDRLRHAIDHGTYSVNGRSVGDAIIRHALTESVL